jgi:hypothetical protein
LFCYGYLSKLTIMFPSFAITPTQPKATQALLRGRLAQLEATLLEARERVVHSFDRELALLRGWMDSLELFDPTVGLKALDEPEPSHFGASLDKLLAEPPPLMASNIVPFSTSAFGAGADAIVEEQPLDPALASATLEQLNAALTAAFEQMEQKCTPDEPRSA